MDFPTTAQPNTTWDDTAYTSGYLFCQTSGMLMSILGVVSNLINVSVFIKQGLHERVNFALFCLSVSEFFASLNAFAVTLTIFFSMYPPSATVDWVAIVMFFFWFRGLFADTSSCLTLFISIERCYCVMQPFKFNTTFTFKTTKMVVLFILVFVIASYLPLMSSMRYTYYTNPELNITILTAEYLQLYYWMVTYNDYVLGILLAIVCQVCIFVCAVLMYRGLRKSTEIRDHTREFQVSESQTGKLARDKLPGLSKKEKRVVKLVLMLAILYLPTGIPQIIYAIFRGYIPEKYYFLCACVVLFFVTANGSFAIFIYYNFSSVYHSTLLCQNKSGKNLKRKNSH
ncbi:uncharacterized protein LOC131946349 [Physella acuta]|uniref:uncharacterized protein LOC131946349 n=1 Tax=Physella acuta TaxID=109671 RepID=UPI0027DB084F|nr:uncharacterized protein LOC131946349 [Physella acuta]